jgi:hypothetical protein
MTKLKHAKESLLRRILDSSAVKLFGVIATVIGLVLAFGSLFHRQTAGNVQNSSLTVNVPSNRPYVRELQPPVRRPVNQSSFGAQSPNVRDVQHDVKIRYESDASGVMRALAARESAIPPKPLGSTRSNDQMSFGDQSPNVSGVGGNVEIDYSSALTSTPATAPEGAR